MSVDTAVEFKEALRELKRQREARRSLPALHEKKGQLEWKLRGLESCLEPVNGEIGRLERSFIASLFGGKEQKLEAKRQEADAMQQQFDECVSELRTVEEELASVDGQLTDPHELEQEITRVYDEKARQIMEAGDETAAQLGDLDQARNGAKIHRQEVNQAERIGKHLLERLFSMTKSVGRARTKGVNSSAVGAIAARAINAALQSSTAKPVVNRVQTGLGEFVDSLRKLQIPAEDKRGQVLEKLQQDFATSEAEMSACGVRGMVWDSSGVSQLVDSVQEAIALLKELSKEAAREAGDWEEQWRALIEQC